MFKLISFFMFLFSASTFTFTFALNTPNNVKPLIRGITAPMDKVTLFNTNSLFKDLNPAFLREAELKHSRLAMLAVVILPTLELFTDGLSINQFQLLDPYIQLELVALMTLVEFQSMLKGWENPSLKPFTLVHFSKPNHF